VADIDVKPQSGAMGFQRIGICRKAVAHEGDQEEARDAENSGAEDQLFQLTA